MKSHCEHNVFHFKICIHFNGELKGRGKKVVIRHGHLAILSVSRPVGSCLNMLGQNQVAEECWEFSAHCRSGGSDRM